MKKLFKKKANKTTQILQVSLLLAVVVSFTACESKNPVQGNQSRVSVTFTTEGHKMTAFSNTGVSRSAKEAGSYLRPGSASDTLVLSEVKILVKQLEFDNDIENDNMDDDSLEFESDPFVVELNTNNSKTTIDKMLPVKGTYDEIEVEIDELDDDVPPIDSVFGKDEHRYSIAARGTFNDKEFLFRTNLETELEMELEPPITIDGNAPVKVKIEVDVSHWFIDANGYPLDPTLESNRTAIEQNIRNSFRAYDWETDNDSDNDQD